MKTSSAKAKGRSLQKTVAWLLQSIFGLSEADVRSTPMGTQGSDVMLSEKALNMFGYDIECKNQEKLNVWQAYDQSKVRSVKFMKERHLEPLLIIKKNHHDPLVVVDLEHFLHLARLNAEQPYIELMAEQPYTES